jgi:hypothetical protein
MSNVLDDVLEAIVADPQIAQHGTAAALPFRDAPTL